MENEFVVNIYNDRYCVQSPYGGIWWPTDEVQENIAQSDDPEETTLELCLHGDVSCGRWEYIYERADLMKLLGNNIRRIRESKGKSVAECARLASWTRSRWYHIEQARTTNITLNTLCRVMAALQCDASELFAHISLG